MKLNMRKILVIFSSFYDHHKRRFSIIMFFMPSPVKTIFTIPGECFWENFVANDILEKQLGKLFTTTYCTFVLADLDF